jgi:hypothetical protein
MTFINTGLKKNGHPESNSITVKYLKDITLILLVVVFSVFHKANAYGWALFDYKICIYIFSWVVFLLGIVFLSRWKLARHGEGILYSFWIGLLLLNYGAIQDFLLHSIKSKWLAANWTLIAVLVLILVSCRFVYRKKWFGYGKPYNFLLVLFALFTLIESYKICGTKKAVFYDYKAAYASVHTPAFPIERPDIYYLIFDSYTSSKALKASWNFSNDSINSFLQQHNFKVTHNAHSAYDFTSLSLNSTFNLNYLPLPAQALQHNLINFNYGRSILGNSLVMKWFDSQGYAIDYLSLLSASHKNNAFYPLAPDEPLHWLRRQTIERVWLEPSLWNKLLSMLGLAKKGEVSPALQAIDDYNKKLLDTVAHLPAIGAPRFLYAHFMLPHNPFIYKRDGSRRTAQDAVIMDEVKAKAFYLDQLIYTNTYIQQLVNALLKDGKRNKVIIIQGDHGYREYLPSDPADRFAIFNAVYFGDGDYSYISDSMLSVNTFRIVLNKYFNQHLKLITLPPTLH